jgi:hypothetical protein
MKVLRIALSASDFDALRTLAHRDRRDPRQQAQVILERSVARHRAEVTVPRETSDLDTDAERFR